MDSVIEEDVEILLKKINLVLNNFDNFDKAILNDVGDIIIRNKITRRTKKKENSILANVFKQIISEDIKKNRV